MDYMYQLWTVLEASGDEALVVWDLRHKRVQIAIPWGRKPIVLGATAANPLYSKAKVVIAGANGSTKLSTASLSWPQ